MSKRFINWQKTHFSEFSQDVKYLNADYCKNCEDANLHVFEARILGTATSECRYAFCVISSVNFSLKTGTSKVGAIPKAQKPLSFQNMPRKTQKTVSKRPKGAVHVRSASEITFSPTGNKKILKNNSDIFFGYCPIVLKTLSTLCSQWFCFK